MSVPDPTPAPAPGLAGMKLILKRNHGLTDDELAGIETVEDAKLVLEDIRKNSAIQPPKGAFLQPNVGPAAKLPPAEDMTRAANAMPGDGNPRRARLANPLSVEGNLGLRFNSMARLLTLITDDYPDGRVF